MKKREIKFRTAPQLVEPRFYGDFYVKELNDTYSVVCCADGSSLLQTATSRRDAHLVCAMLNNFLIIRDDAKCKPALIAEMILIEAYETKPINTEL